MESTSIATEYFEARPELMSVIQSFEKKRNLSLLSKLQEENNSINFFSTLAEIRTGLFFDPLCSDMRHNSPLARKRPDWWLKMGDQQIICEVLRLNTAEEECKASIEHSRAMRKLQLENPGVPMIQYANARTIDTAYLCGAQSKLQYKESKYRQLIEHHRLPFIICVNPSVDTYINATDLHDFLMGRYGFYATDEYFGRNVNGVLLQGYFTGHWVYFNNETAAFPLTKDNHRLMEGWN